MKQGQIDYFQKVDSLLQANNFDPKHDRVLAFDYDYATLLYLNATNYGGLMHHIENMPVYKTIFDLPENAPDYILVCRSHRRRIARIAQQFQWNFPQEYTEYTTGNPDGQIDMPDFKEARSLFIKNKKTE